jgi:hypothetical protein
VVYHTYIHLSVAFSVGATTEPELIAMTWGGKFVGRNAVKEGTNEPLHYYKEWDTEVRDADKLLETRDGKCMAWTKLFLNALGSAGLTARPQNYVVISPKPLQVPTATFTGLMIKEWNFNGAGSNTDPASNGVYPYINGYQQPLGDPMYKKEANGAWVYNWGPGAPPDVTDAAGIPGQNTANPHSLFSDHVVAKLDGKYYDSSYGRVWDSRQHFEDTAVAGFYGQFTQFPGTANSRVVYGFRKNPDGEDVSGLRYDYNPTTGQLSNQQPDN